MTSDHRERGPVDLGVQCEADQLDGIGERIEPADGVDDRARLLHQPQRVQRGRGEEHREDHEVHHAGEVLELADHRGQQHAERAEHHAGQRERGQHGEIAPDRRLDAPEPGDDQIGVDLRDRHHGACQQFAGQQEPARERADQQHAHVAHLAVVDHRQRGLHAVEQLDHRHQSGRDIDLVQDIGLVRRNDRHAEDLAEAGGEDEQPHQRPHQRRDEALALMQEAQRLAPGDAAQADEILAEPEARASVAARGDAHSGSLRRRAGQRDEGAAHVGGAGRCHDIRHIAGRHAPGRDAARRPHRRLRPHRADGSPTARRRHARGPASAHGAGWRSGTRRPARPSVRPAPGRAAGAAVRVRSRPAASVRPTTCAPSPWRGRPGRSPPARQARVAAPRECRCRAARRDTAGSP